MKNSLNTILTWAAWIYLGLVFTWFALYLFSGDRIGYVGLANYVAQWFFLPLVLVAFIAALVRRRSLWIGLAAAGLVFLWLWGGLFLPRPSQARAAAPQLRVMTFNMLGMHGMSGPPLEMIRKVDADVVFIQELGFASARALESELLELYPYQVLDPGAGPEGMGLISKHTLRDRPEKLPADWVGIPQIHELDWFGQPVLLVNFHTYSTWLMPPAAQNANFRAREAQMQALADLAAAAQGPIIIAGDANASPLNEAYKILAAELDDAWARAGYGFGHTFPGSDIPVSDRPRFMGVLAPQWLWRIDHIFFSDEWDIQAAYLAPFDGLSDHRGVIAELVLPAAAR